MANENISVNLIIPYCLGSTMSSKFHVTNGVRQFRSSTVIKHM